MKHTLLWHKLPANGKLKVFRKLKTVKRKLQFIKYCRSPLKNELNILKTDKIMAKHPWPDPSSAQCLFEKKKNNWIIAKLVSGCMGLSNPRYK